jgi:Uma2 family endonuclease
MVDEFARMSARGGLPEGRRFELLGGEIIEKLPHGPRHDTRVDRIAACLGRLAWPEPFHCRQEKTVRLSAYNDPQPDASVIRGRSEDYEDRYPDQDDALLVVEVADSSLDYDRGARLRAYAGAGIREYWIVNLREECLEVYREPHGGGFANRRVFRRGDEIMPLAAPSAAVAVTELLGP